MVLYSFFHFGHICRGWDQCAVHILYYKISRDPDLLEIRHSHRFVAVVIQFVILFSEFRYIKGQELHKQRYMRGLRNQLFGYLKVTLIKIYIFPTDGPYGCIITFFKRYIHINHVSRVEELVLLSM